MVDKLHVNQVLRLHPHTARIPAPFCVPAELQNVQEQLPTLTVMQNRLSLIKQIPTRSLSVCLNGVDLLCSAHWVQLGAVSWSL